MKNKKDNKPIDQSDSQEWENVSKPKLLYARLIIVWIYEYLTMLSF